MHCSGGLPYVIANTLKIITGRKRTNAHEDLITFRTGQGTVLRRARWLDTILER